MLTLLSSSRCSVNCSNHCGVSLFFSCVFFFEGSRDRFPDAGMLVLRRRIVAGLDEESSVVSCDNDAGDVLAVELEEPVDTPGTTIGTKFSVFHWICLPFWVECGF